MKISQTVELTTTTEEIIDIICNHCGGTCKVHEYGFYGLIEAAVYGGYSSPVLADCMRYEFSMCEPCLGKLFGQFKHPPTMKEVGAFAGDNEG